jgi:excisionase family DNA binding protein
MQDPTRLLKADELAERWRLHPTTLRDLARRRLIPSVKIGGAVRFQESAIERYLKAVST